MKIPSIYTVAIFVLGVAFPLFAQTPAPPRTWTTTEGKTFQATLVSVQGSQVTVRVPTGQLAAIGLPRLSPADQAYVKGLATPAGATPAPGSAATPHSPIEKRVWPQKVEVDLRAIEVSVVSEEPAKQKCVYRSRNFEFTAQDKLAPSVMKELARTFEATRSLREGLPWAVNPKPPAGASQFAATLFTTNEDFYAAGGNRKEGATFRYNDAVFLVPFKSLGLEQHGKVWVKNGKFDDNALVLEISKQMMYGSYRYLPPWIWQGIAEYAGMLPNNAGVIIAGSHERGLKEFIKHASERGISPGDTGPVIDLMQMQNDAWSQRILADDKNRLRLHINSGLLVYFFCHLDGDGKGTRFLRYMDKIAEARDAGIAPGAKSSFGFSQMDILLDGRSKEEMQKAVAEGFKKIGVPW